MAKTVCRERGFTLTELLIVVVIIGILTAITYPAYRGFVLQSNRSDAHISLLEASQQLERWFTENNTYAGYTYNGTDITTSGSAAASRQGQLCPAVHGRSGCLWLHAGSHRQRRSGK